MKGSLASETELARCRESLRVGSRSFFLASCILPSRLAVAASVLYDFCRELDDRFDCNGGGAAAIEQYRRRLDAVFDDRPGTEDAAISALIKEYSLSRAPFDALLDGMHWDCEGRQYADGSDLLAYAVRVAGSVGVLMAQLMGVRCPIITARASDLGVAMQLTNIARDVGEDARNGRLYLPHAWLEDAGVDRARFLAAPQWNDAVASVIARLLATARPLYRRADSGIAQLPLSVRPALYAASAIYEAIGSVVAANHHDSISRRAVVPTATKLRLAARSILRSFSTADLIREEAVPEARFVLAALPEARRDHWLDPGVHRLLSMFYRLESGQSMARTPPGNRPRRVGRQVVISRRASAG